MGPEQILTFPDLKVIEKAASHLDDYMRPNVLPYAVVFENYLSDDECDAIVDYMMEYEPYSFPHCGAMTREADRPLNSCMDPIETAARTLNDIWWKYKLDEDPAAWFQTYEPGATYPQHMDGSIAQTRKLTAVALLTDPDEYRGGCLRLWAPRMSMDVPKTRGTICVFPPWLLHDVQQITAGTRQTINMGFYGPQFK